MSSLRLGSFNLLSGRSLHDGAIEEARLVEAIGELDVEVLAVQEVDRGQPRSGGVDQTAVIAATLGAVTSRFVATLDGTPGEQGWTPSIADDGLHTLNPAQDSPATQNSLAATQDQPQFGVALISRLPVVEWHVLRMKPPPGRFPLPIPSRPPRILWLNDEPRVAVAAVLQSPRITIACTHLSFVPLANVRQLLAIRRWLARLPGPQLLLGDLNLPAAAARRISGWTPLVSAPTFPSPAPRLRLDQVLASGLPIGSRAAGRVHRQLPISDHRAVQVDLELPDLWAG